MKHLGKWARVIAMGCLAAAVALCACGCGGGSSDDEDTEDQGPSLTEQEQEIVSTYGDDQKEMLSTLASNKWATQGKGSTVTFSADDDTMTVTTIGSDTTSHSFAIAAINDSGDDSDSDDGDDGTDTQYVTISADGNTYTMLYTTMTEDSKKNVSDSYIEIPGLLEGGSFWRVPAQQQIAVSAPPKWTASLKVSDVDVRSAIAQWCAENAPAVTKAKCTGNATVDDESETLELEYELNDEDETTISVVCNTKTGEVDSIS